MATELNENEATQETVDVPSITAGDLSTVVRIIDAGSQRGAWRGEELSVIGTLRNKLVTVLKVVAPETVIENETQESASDSSEESAA